MGRPPKFSEDQILDAAAALVATGRPEVLTASAVARSLAAPSGSLYHRYASRDHLVAALWLRTVERFDREVVSGVHADGDPLDVAVSVARRVVRWCIANPTDAHVLTRLSIDDLIDVTADGTTDSTVPTDIADRARRLRRRQRRSISRLAHRLSLPADQVALAIAEIPHAAVRRALVHQRPIAHWVPAAVAHAARAVLTTQPCDTDDDDTTDTTDNDTTTDDEPS